jgi:hypothetical protein
MLRSAVTTTKGSIMAEIKYIVRRAFRYGKLHLKPGDEFIPDGGLFDEQIIKSHLVKADNGDAFVSKNRRAWRSNRYHGKIVAPVVVEPVAEPVLDFSEPYEVIEPVVKKPSAVKKPVAKKAVAKEPAAKKPVAVVKKPVVAKRPVKTAPKKGR